MSDTSGELISIEHGLESRLTELQQQLDAVRQQLVESQRLATIGTISAVVAHEFNNLLTPIVSYCQYALQSAEQEQPDMDLIRKALSKSCSSADRAGQICHSMLGLARGHTQHHSASVQRIVDDTLLVLARDPAKDGIALRVQVQPELTVRCDPVQLEQVLLNLLINARQAMLGKGGALTIKATRVESTGEVKIQVIDTGPGIPERIQPRIFEPFFTTKGTARKGEKRGTGLGLHVCKEIIEQHRGRIELQSEVGKGTTFTVFLPGAPSQ
ncbi:MAG: sensor histidine kinase [Tepidisphaerales bacterium]